MSFFKEFKEFINQGDVMDMAVGIIIGGALTAIVTALTSDIIQPLISACINFLIIAFIVFCLVKGVNKMRSVGKKKEEEAPAAPCCPFCLEEVKVGATRCPHCAGAFDAPATAE